MSPEIAAGTGFVAGAAIAALVHWYFRLGILSATVSNLMATCVPGSTYVRIQCTVVPDSGCTVSGVWAKVYDNPNTTPGDSVDSTATFVQGTGSFDFPLPTPSPNSDPDLVAVWPEYKSTGAPVSRQFGPCTTGTPSSSSSTSSSTSSSSTTRSPMGARRG